MNTRKNPGSNFVMFEAVPDVDLEKLLEKVAGAISEELLERIPEEVF